MKTTLNNFFKKTTKKGMRSRLSVFEAISLWNTARRDGRAGLPKHDASGLWTSPTVQKEINACNETHGKVFATLRLELEKDYVEAATLSDRILRYEARIDELSLNMPAPMHKEDGCIRKQGEEQLSDAQIKRRRQREYDKLGAAARAELVEVQRKMEDCYEKLVELNNYLLEKNHEATIICEKIRSHTQQRIDYYWNIITRVAFLNKSAIPVVFSGVKVADVVDSYQMACQQDNRKIAEVIEHFRAKREAA